MWKNVWYTGAHYQSSTTAHWRYVNKNCQIGVHAQAPGGHNEGRTRDSVRGDAWGCGSDEILRAILWQEF